MKIKSLIIFIIFLLSMLTLSACSSDYNKVIENNWQISFPKGYKELSSTDSGASFHGDGKRYHIFSYEEELEQSEIENFSSQKDTTIENEAENILISLKVSREERPNFSKEYYWYKKSDSNDSRNNLYLIYFMEDKVLYAIEEFY